MCYFEENLYKITYFEGTKKFEKEEILYIIDDGFFIGYFKNIKNLRFS